MWDEQVSQPASSLRHEKPVEVSREHFKTIIMENFAKELGVPQTTVDEYTRYVADGCDYSERGLKKTTTEENEKAVAMRRIDANMERMWSKIDANDDGNLSFNEFLGLICQIGRAGRVRKVVLNNVKKADLGEGRRNSSVRELLRI